MKTFLRRLCRTTHFGCAREEVCNVVIGVANRDIIVQLEDIVTIHVPADRNNPHQPHTMTQDDDSKNEK